MHNLPLFFIHNQSGFRFKGKLKSGGFIRCLVIQGSDGLHYVVNEDNMQRCFHLLESWDMK